MIFFEFPHQDLGLDVQLRDGLLSDFKNDGSVKSDLARDVRCKFDLIVLDPHEQLHPSLLFQAQVDHLDLQILAPVLYGIEHRY